MKKFILTLGIAIACYSSYAQNNTSPWPATGHVGIGTQYPNESLTIARAGLSALGVYRDLDVNTDGSAGQNIDIGARNGSAFTAGAQIQGVLDNTTTTGRLYFNTLSGGSMTTKLMINSDGNVGIGTTSPGAKLEVNGIPAVDANLVKFSGSDPNGNLFTEIASNGTGGAILKLTGGGGSAFGLQSSGTLSGVGNNKLSFFSGSTIIATMLPSGYVGIGTNSPTSLLNVSGTTPVMRIDASNNNTTGTLHFQGRDSNAGQTSKAQIVHGVTETVNGIGSTLDFLTTKESSSGMTFTSSMFIDKQGNLGVGTKSPDTKLTVNGTIHSTEVKVESTVPTPDYVFEPDYNLRSLEELKAYVDKNHHLPEIPSAKEIEKNGIQLGDMNMRLLKKIEELTLYLIEKDKQVDTLQNEMRELKQQINTISNSTKK